MAGIGDIYSKQQRRKQAESNQSSGKAHARSDKRQQVPGRPIIRITSPGAAQPDSDLTFPLSGRRRPVDAEALQWTVPALPVPKGDRPDQR